jgi:aerobic C4-dicarboxylate transport protein
LAEPKKPLHRQLYAQTLLAIVLAALFGALFPAQADALWVKALGDGFVKLVKMTIAPVIFCTVAGGIAHLPDARKVGRVGVKALLYFETVSTFALSLGLLVGELVRPGAGFPGHPDAAAVEQYAKKASAGGGAVDFLLGVIPETIFGAFSQGQILQVLFVAILFGFSLMAVGEKTERLRVFLDDAGHATFGVVGIVMKAAPIGAFGAMAYTVGHYGLASLSSLAWLVGSFYLSATLFVLLALGAIARFTGFSILR